MGHTLVIQLARMGDLAQSLPLCRDLREACGERVSLLVDERCRPVARVLAPWLHEVHTLDLASYLRAFRSKRSWVGLWEALAGELRPALGETYDRVINLNFGKLSASVAGHFHGRAPLSGFCAEGGESRGDPWTDLFRCIVQANRRWSRWHLVDAFRAHARARVETRGCGGGGPERKGGGTLALQLGTRASKRTWPEEAFVEVIRGVRSSRGPEILLLGEAGEKDRADRVLRAAGADRVHNLVGSTSIQELVEVLKSSDGLVSGDTGTLHLASWLGVPTIGVFFGPALCFETGPYGPGQRVLQGRAACAPCREDEACPHMRCLEPLTPGVVLAGLRGERPPPRAGYRSYRAENVGGWLLYRPDQRGPAGREDVLAHLYWGAAGQMLGEDDRRFPSMADALGFLASAHEVSGVTDVPEEGFWEHALPRRVAPDRRDRLRDILKSGWSQLGEHCHVVPEAEPVRPATAAAGADPAP